MTLSTMRAASIPTIGPPQLDPPATERTLTDQLLDEWALWMRAAGMSERTVDNRQTLVLQFDRFAAVYTGDVDVAAVADWTVLAAFLGRKMVNGERISPGTRQTNHADLSAWFGWLRVMGYRADSPVDQLHKPKTVKRRPRPVSTRQLERVLQTVNRRRTRAMVLLGAYQGFRVHEIAKMRGEHIDGDQLYVLGKGGREDWLPLHPDVAAIAGEFPRYGWWFPAYGDRRGPITANSVCTVISRLMDRAEVNATAHQLRHWFGTEVLRSAGGNARIAQELLRHESLDTTARYTLVDDAERRAAVYGLPRPGDDQPSDVVRRLRIAA